MLNSLQLKATEAQKMESQRVCAKLAKHIAAPAAKKATGAPADSKILRFAKAERMVHWAIAGPFLVSFASAVILVLFYNPDPSRPYRIIFATIHRVSGAALILLPMLATLKSRGDARIHFYNIKQAWTWVFDDFRWLALMGLAAVSSKIKLPEQGKFNAAEKINFMVLMTTYPLYVATGLLMWLTHLAILSWIMHFLMAVLATPLLLGHLYMALINPDTRKGLGGMFSGRVERQWAKHHYARWYKETHEDEEKQAAEAGGKEHASPTAPVSKEGPGAVSPVVREERTVRPAVIPAEEPAPARSEVQWFISEIDAISLEAPSESEEEEDLEESRGLTTTR